MKKQIYLLLIVLALGCQNRDKFLSGIDSLIVGKWEQTAYEQVLSNGNKEWKTLDSLTGKPSFIVRSDGAFLDGNGKGMCCWPGGKIIVNGEALFLNPTMPVPYNELCELIDCISCNNNVFEVEEEKLIWVRCGTIRSQYRRLP